MSWFQRHILVLTLLNSGRTPLAFTSFRTMASSVIPGEFSVSYVTTPSKEVAEKIARGLVEKRLAACVNIVPGLTSIYRWEGKIEEDSEVLLMVKSPTAAIDNMTSYVKANHPYKVFELISTPIQNGNPEYTQFLRDVTIGRKH